MNLWARLSRENFKRSYLRFLKNWNIRRLKSENLTSRSCLKTFSDRNKASFIIQQKSVRIHLNALSRVSTKAATNVNKNIFDIFW